MDPVIFKLLAFVLTFLAVFLFVLQFFPSQEDMEMRKKTGLFVAREWGEDAVLLKWFYPLVALIVPLVKLLPLSKYKKNIGRWITSAGLEGSISTNEFIGLQIVLAFFFPGMMLLVFSGVTTFLVGFLLGLFFPVLWLLDKKKTRQEDILIAMPTVVDMLSLSVEAGIDFNAAIIRVCEQHKNEDRNPLIEEFIILQQNIQLGMTREEGLKNMAHRVDLQDIYSFTSVLIQADKMGASIASILKQQSEKLRRERFMKAERLGAEASQKLLIPMVIFIFPLIFFVVMGPYVLQFIYGK